MSKYFVKINDKQQLKVNCIDCLNQIKVISIVMVTLNYTLFDVIVRKTV